MALSSARRQITKNSRMTALIPSPVQQALDVKMQTGQTVDRHLSESQPNMKPPPSASPPCQTPRAPRDSIRRNEAVNATPDLYTTSGGDGSCAFPSNLGS
ncbi:hypothetical protein GWI33_017419 [Rhynchophorus ferrugineus]|uniref:Uncharacterized protein n=1 Tax=Rhynchophorus ferrugineus TaxID=354439 RepID=A0A834MJQ2_RHYFE|nr:hypothetical protein GWI33_017419 [Rhynchophorus ferrugineus]